MDPDSLFDFDTPAPIKRNGSSHKRSAPEPVASSSSSSNEDLKRESISGKSKKNGRAAKVPRLSQGKHEQDGEEEETLMPVAVTDDFMTEASQSIPVGQGSKDSTSAHGDSAEASKMTVKHEVRHQVAIPPGYDYVPLSKHVEPAEPAKTYPFTLDPFQQTSIHSIQRGESVLVSAHTSAGKTVIAEYAIAQCLKNGQRVVYTSPIKALSNQKYREMQAEFGDVGLMTGDVTINPSASCLVMTTEVSIASPRPQEFQH